MAGGIPGARSRSFISSSTVGLPVASSTRSNRGSSIESSSTDNVFYRYRYAELTVAALVVGLSALQLLIFAGRIKTGMDAERAAHFCEFVNEIFNGLFALFYAVLTYMDLRKRTSDHCDEMRKLV